MRLGAHIKDEYDSTISYLISEITTNVYKNPHSCSSGEKKKNLATHWADWSHTALLHEPLKGQAQDTFCWLSSPSFTVRNNFLNKAKVKKLTDAHARKVRASKTGYAQKGEGKTKQKDSFIHRNNVMEGNGNYRVMLKD